MPKVSVIIPVYNSGEYLSKCLESILNQTLSDIEIICVDDGSTDDSLKILHMYQGLDKRIKIVHQENKFAGVARNTGMAMAKGRYYVFLDSDDFFEPDLLELEYNRCESLDADICLCGADKYDMKNAKFVSTPWLLNTEMILSEITNSQKDPNNIFRITTACPWTKMFRADFIKKNKLEFQALPRANDLYFVLCSIFLAKKIVYVDKTLVHYRVGNTLSLQNNNNKSPFAFIEALEKTMLRLNIKECTSEHQRAFANIAMEHIAYNLRTLEKNDPRLCLTVGKIIRDRYIATFGITGKTENYFYNKKDFLFLCDKKVIKQIGHKENKKNLETFEKKIVRPKVSFIVPVYNRESYIRECLDSLQKQSEQNIEIICVNDNSTDDSLKVLNNLSQNDNRIKVINHGSNKGAGGSRNTGLEYASGEYVWFIDADDYIDKSALEILLNVFDEYPQVDVITFNAAAFKYKNGKNSLLKEGSIVRNWPTNRVLSLKESETIPDSIDGSSVTYITKHNISERYRFRECVAFEDADYSFKILTSDIQVYCLENKLYYRRITETSTTGKAAQGENPTCILGRLLACREISNIIETRKFSKNHYGVKWFKRWAKFSIELYLKHMSLHEKYYNKIIQNLQLEYKIFANEDLLHEYQYHHIFFPEIIVSLTSYPARITTVERTIVSLLNQTFLPDKILLWLAKDQFASKDIPEKLKILEEKNEKFSIKYCNSDLKPHKKYFYVMQEEKEAIVITVDDDVIYDETLVHDLLMSYLNYPKMVSCMRGHTIKMYDEKTFAPYEKWQKEKHIVNKPTTLIIPTGVGGVLYPPNSIPKISFNEDLIYKLCLTTDDLWLKWMQLKNDTECVLLRDNCLLNYIDGTQDTGLWVTNVNKQNNDIVWEKIISADVKYNVDKDVILKNLYNEYQNRVVDKENKYESQYKYELEQVKASWSYRIGRGITFIPRKIRGGVRCYQEHGMRYTLRRIKEKCKW